jgi:hypothetical protein
MRGSLAALAQAAHDELRALGAEAAAAGGAEGCRGVDPHIQILDCSAGSANEMVMPLGAGVPQGGGAAGGDPVCDAQLLEKLQSGVDGRQRGVREPRLHASEHLFSGRVSSEIAERAVDEDPLRRGAKATFPEALLELLISH